MVVDVGTGLRLGPLGFCFIHSSFVAQPHHLICRSSSQDIFHQLIFSILTVLQPRSLARMACTERSFPKFGMWTRQFRPMLSGDNKSFACPGSPSSSQIQVISILRVLM